MVLTFDDIEPNIEIAVNFNYSPQAEEKNELDIKISETDDYIFATQQAGTKNKYQWLFNNDTIIGANKAQYSVTYTTFKDEGNYTCQISNTIAPDLILLRRPYNLTVKPLPINYNDSLVLIEIYKATNGNLWKTQWDTINAPVEDWKGVFTIKGRVIKLQLPDNEPNGSSPITINELTELETINLSKNLLNGQFIINLQELSKLVSINFSDNFMNGELNFNSPTINHTALRHIDVAKNQFSGALPPEINKFINLEELYINGNEFSGTINGKINKLTKLTELNLSSNNFNDTIPNDFYKMTELNFLDISNNNFVGGFSDEIANLTKLTYLSASNNELSGAIPKEIGNLTKLITIELDENKIEGTLPPSIGLLENIESFDIYNNKISGQIPDSYTNINPINFDLSYNNLSGQIPNDLGNDKLKYINLSNNKFTGSISLNFANMKAISQIYVNNNQFEDLENLSNIALNEITSFLVYNNKLTFEDLEENANTIKGFQYIPQINPDTTILTIDAGDDYKLKYEIDGIYNKYSWKKETTPINSDSSSYIINNIAIHNQGSYTCTVSNPNAAKLIITKNFRVYLDLYITSPQIEGPLPYCIGTNIINLTASRESQLEETSWYYDKELKQHIADGKQTRVVINQDVDTIYAINKRDIFKSSISEYIVYIRPTITLERNILKASENEFINSYEWYYNNKLVDGEISSTIALQGNGIYQVTAISNLCSSTSYDVIYQNGDFDIVGVFENAKLNNTEIVEIYPNPNKGLFNIKIANNHFGKIILQLTDISGKIIMIKELTKSKNNFDHAIDITHLDKGIYFIEIISRKGKVVKKIMKY